MESEETKKVEKEPVDDTPVTAIITFVGAQWVGKTSVIQRFLYDEFKGIYIPTLGMKWNKIFRVCWWCKNCCR